MPKDLRLPAATLWAAHNTHIVHYPLRGWKLFNLVATVIGKHTSGGHNELAMPDEVLPLFSHYCEKPTKLMRTPKEYRRWMLLYRQPVDNWIQGRVALLGDAAHFMLQYMAQGAAMAMEDAVCLGACADAGGRQFREEPSRSIRRQRIVRATRVQISANQLVGMIFHVPDGLEREVRNDMYRGGARRALLRRARVDLQRAGLRARLQGDEQVAGRSRAAERTPQSCIARTSSVDRISSARRAPGSPPAIAPKSVARPVSTRLRAERARLEDVDAAAHAAVEQHRELAADRPG